LQLALSISENNILTTVETESPMPEAVIVSALRTPIGTAMKGTLRDTDAYQLGEHVVSADEAFASMCVATIKLLDIDPEIVNVSGCLLGHPVAATGARMLVTLVHELRRRGRGVGVAAMCAGGGMGSATVIEIPAP
jgi:acetyl-CoA acetyltransferase